MSLLLRTLRPCSMRLGRTSSDYHYQATHCKVEERAVPTGLINLSQQKHCGVFKSQ